MIQSDIDVAVMLLLALIMALNVADITSRVTLVSYKTSVNFAQSDDSLSYNMATIKTATTTHKPP